MGNMGDLAAAWGTAAVKDDFCCDRFAGEKLRKACQAKFFVVLPVNERCSLWQHASDSAWRPISITPYCQKMVGLAAALY